MAVDVISVTSEALRGNPLGDPHVRKLHIIRPERTLAPGERLPCIWWLAGYAGVSRGMLAHDPWQEGLEERVLRLQEEGRMGDVIVVLPDAFTKYGGCQYISSSALGDYERYLFDEVHGLVSQRYPISRHALAGKSSGGFGAMVNAMRYPDRFAAVACHSGDMGFDLFPISDLPYLMDAVRDYGSIEAFVQAFDAATTKKQGRWFGPISMVALCAAYSPAEDKPLGIELPFDPTTGAFDRDVLNRWFAWDPVRMIEREEHREALRNMRLVYVDCGNRDEHHLHWGARQLSAKLRAYGIEHEHQEFEGGHRGTSHRLDVSFPMLYEALTQA